MSVKVSIIMGIYNCEDTLSRAIDSIINQTYTNWELIMCDDCSKDSTLEIAKNFEKKFPNKIKVISNDTNLKLAATLNRCLKYAKGEYIARMDADDFSFPDRLKKQAEFLDNNKVYHVVSCRSVVFDENGEREVLGNEGEANSNCMLRTVPFMHPTIMMRKSVYDDLDGYTVLPRTERGQDMDLWFRFFSKGYKGYTLPDVLYKYYNFQSTINKRKNLRLAVCYTKTKLVGFKLLHFPIYKYIFAFKPFVSLLMPEKIIIYYRKCFNR